MATRRGFLAGLVASTVTPVPTWADAGNPSFLSAARAQNGGYVLVGLDPFGAERFRIALPARGHAGAAHPTRPEAVAFARRPGTFAFVLDCRDGSVIARLDSQTGRHFYGHGTFDQTGALLFTTENDYEAGRGVIGVWDARKSYARLGEFSSQGIGPHEMARMPDGSLVIANGGIDTHPDTGREKLNLPTMRPNLTYVTPYGEPIDQIEPDHHLASIRHLSVRADGLVGIGMQWQGAVADAPPLIATHRVGGPWTVFGAGDTLSGYVGSVAFSADGMTLAVTSPRAGTCQMVNMISPYQITALAEPDVCGLAASTDGLLMTNGQGVVRDVSPIKSRMTGHDLSFDNHLVAI